MKPIIEYSDFRQYMRDFYEERKLRHVFSWREFSKNAGFTSSSYMKVVCDGKSNLSRIGVERTGQAMGLVGFEMDYFRAMVKFGQETDDEKKKVAYAEMLAIAKEHKVRVIEGDLFETVTSCLRELMSRSVSILRRSVRSVPVIRCPAVMATRVSYPVFYPGKTCRSCPVANRSF